MSALLLRHARLHGVPIDLLHRVVIRESRYNPLARHSRYWGLMQITYATARSMGYRGSPDGLLDANVNLTYAVPYLANAYMLSHGNDDRAVRLYASGYYATAKQQHMIADLRTADSLPVVPVRLVAEAEPPRNPVARLFGLLTAPPAAAAAPDAQASAPPAAATSNVPPQTTDAKGPAQVAAAEPEPKGKEAADKKADKKFTLAGKTAAGAKTTLAKADASREEKVAAATTAPQPDGDHLRGSVDRLPGGTFQAADAASVPATAAAEAPLPAMAPKASKPGAAKVRVASRAAAKTVSKKTVPAAEPAEVATADESAAEAPAFDADVQSAAPAPSDKASGARRAHGSRGAKRMMAAAKPAPADEAAAADEAGTEADTGTEARTTKLAKAAKPKVAVRHPNAVVQASASKAELDPQRAADR